MKNKISFFFYKNDMIWLRKYRTKFAICWTQTSYPMWTHTRERINNVQVADLLIMLELEGKLLKLQFISGAWAPEKRRVGLDPEAAWL